MSLNSNGAGSGLATQPTSDGQENPGFNDQQSNNGSSLVSHEHIEMQSVDTLPDKPPSYYSKSSSISSHSDIEYINNDVVITHYDLKKIQETYAKAKQANKNANHAVASDEDILKNDDFHSIIFSEESAGRAMKGGGTKIDEKYAYSFFIFALFESFFYLNFSLLKAPKSKAVIFGKA